MSERGIVRTRGPTGAREGLRVFVANTEASGNSSPFTGDAVDRLVWREGRHAFSYCREVCTSPDESETTKQFHRSFQMGKP